VFFFTDYEGTKIRESSNASSTLPTLLMRTGDFSELLTQRKLAITDPKNGAAFPGNIIPANRLDPLALKLASLYPTQLTSSTSANFVYQAPKPQDVDKYDKAGVVSRRSPAIRKVSGDIRSVRSQTFPGVLGLDTDS
jgi:hypothetical protein